MGRDSAFGSCLGLLPAGADSARRLRGAVPCWLESEHGAAFAIHLISSSKVTGLGEWYG